MLSPRLYEIRDRDFLKKLDSITKEKKGVSRWVETIRDHYTKKNPNLRTAPG